MRYAKQYASNATKKENPVEPILDSAASKNREGHPILDIELIFKNALHSRNVPKHGSASQSGSVHGNTTLTRFSHPRPNQFQPWQQDLEQDLGRGEDGLGSGRRDH